jgi:hypothetical protein
MFQNMRYVTVCADAVFTAPCSRVSIRRDLVEIIACRSAAPCHSLSS